MIALNNIDMESQFSEHYDGDLYRFFHIVVKYELLKKSAEELCELSSTLDIYFKVTMTRG